MLTSILIIVGGSLLCVAAWREGYNHGWNKGWDAAEKWFRLGI